MYLIIGFLIESMLPNTLTCLYRYLLTIEKGAGVLPYARFEFSLFFLTHVLYLSTSHGSLEGGH